ncbi:hypothetical protein BDV12DRAFT_190435 [Aspergillus spectabilis]
MRPKFQFPKPRSRAKEGPAFVFIDATESLSDVPQDEASRALIRRQAARSGRKHQSTQNPSREATNIPGQSTTVVLPGVGKFYVDNGDCELIDLFLTPQPSSTGYEVLKMKYNFDIRYLTSFFDVSLGKPSSLLYEQRTFLINLLQQQPSSFLNDLPSRYSWSPHLDDAMNCLAARVGSIFGFSTRPATVTALYGKALQSLQIALANRDLMLNPDVYCATRLLTLYELVSRPEENHWVLHGRGGINLVGLRGPSNHNTRFDWMLLKSRGLFFVLDDMFKSRGSIFEAPEWQSMFGLMCFVPAIIAELKTLCLKPVSQSEIFKRSSNLLERARWLYNRMHDSHTCYQNNKPSPPSLLSLPVAPESLDRIRLRLFHITCLIQICRALATVSVEEIERATGEHEAQTLEAQALLIQEKTTDLDPAMSFHFQQGIALFASTVQTKTLWASEKERDLTCELPGFLSQRWLEWQFFVDGFITESLDA